MKSTFLVLILFCYCFMAMAQDQSYDAKIKSLVTSNYDHGMPYHEAHVLGKQAVPILEKMLANDSYKPYQTNIIIILGMIGDNSCLPIITSYLSKQQGELSSYEFVTVLASFLSIGYLANKDDKALSFLIEWSDIHQWSKTPFQFRFQSYQNDKMGFILSEIAIKGLGASGKKEALNALYQMQNSLDAKSSLRLQGDIKDAITLNLNSQKVGFENSFNK